MNISNVVVELPLLQNVSTESIASLLPADLSSLLTLLFSFGALRDWLKLFVLGGALETCRRTVFGTWRSLISQFYITAEFDEDDDSYDWMMVWLSKHPSWTTARELQVSTRSFGLETELVTSSDSEIKDGGRNPAYLPNFNTSYIIWYQRHWMQVTRSRQTGPYGRAHETLELKLFSRDQKVLNTLLLEARKVYKANSAHTISVYVADSNHSWNYLTARPKRPLHSIVLDPGIKDVLLEDATDFLGSHEWYSARGIPFRRGYLLHGAPGSGKTSVIHSLAGELGLDVYVVSLSKAGIDDSSLNELISNLPSRCIALMEDIDAAFHHGITREADPSSTLKDPAQTAKPEAPASRVTLSGLLNALDGIGAQEGRILFATTNKYGSLDPALIRPGRMDLHVEFKLASKFQAQELFKCFFPPAVDVPETKGDEKDHCIDSGIGTPNTVHGDLIELDDPPTSSSQSVSLEHSSPPISRLLSISTLRRAPRLSSAQTFALAARFADAIPEREFSMASLQGLLMMYKTRPREAVAEAPAWVEAQRAARMTDNAIAPSSSR